jgi:hypothetical protein
VSYLEESLSDGEKVVAQFRQHWVTRIWLAIWILLIVTIPIAVYEWLRLRTMEHAVTNKRVVFKQGIMGRILGFGDIKVTGRGISDVLFRRMADPMDVKRRIEGVSHPAA